MTLQNFQSHKNTELVFSPGLNAIIGPSDSGKSAILRALRWLIFNRPSGEAFRSTWGGDTIVTAMFSGCKDPIKRYKTSSGNGYQIGESKYEAIGTGVPEEVAQILNIDDTNFQRQLDSPFLLDASAGEVAQHFNRVAHLDKIDTAIQYIQSKCRSLGQSIGSDESILKRLDEELKEYSYLPQFEAGLHVLDELQAKINGITSKSSRIKEILSSINQIDEEAEEYKAISKLGPEVDKLLSLDGQVKARQKEVQDLSRWVRDYANLETNMKTLEEDLLRKEQQFQDSFPDVCPLCGQEVIRCCQR